VTTVPRISYARSADGVSLAFTTAGHGPALVFVPWVPFSNLRMEWQSALLGGIFERLARRLTVIHYDWRGTGHSQRDVTDLSLDANVADLLAVVDRRSGSAIIAGRNRRGGWRTAPVLTRRSRA
jgi:pimeloyl-ACP methyl ester carboxylesterase